MVSLMQKHKNILLIITIAFFVGSIAFVGAGVFMEEYGPNSAAAIVGKHKIKYKDFENAYRVAERNMREKGEDIDDNTPRKLRQEVLQALINQESLAQAAEKYGLGVSDLEVAYDIKSTFSDRGLFNKKAYVWVVRNQFGLNPKDYEDMIKKQKLAAKFQNNLILSAKVTPQEAEFFNNEEPKTPAKGKGAKTAEEKQLQADAMALALMEIKAQSLADSFTKQFNEQEKIEVKIKEIF